MKEPTFTYNASYSTSYSGPFTLLKSSNYWWYMYYNDIRRGTDFRTIQSESVHHSMGTLDAFGGESAIRQFGSRIVTSAVVNDASNNDCVAFSYTDNEGSSWTDDIATTGEDGFNIPTVAGGIRDIIKIGSSYYAFLVDYSNPNIRIFEVFDGTPSSSTFDLIWSTAEIRPVCGYYEGSNYRFIGYNTTTTKRNLYEFDGSTITLIEEISSIVIRAGDVYFGRVLKKNNTVISVTRYYSSPNYVVVVDRKISDNDWISFSRTTTNYLTASMGILDNSYDPNYIVIQEPFGSGNFDIYLITPSGDFGKIISGTSPAAEIICWWGDYLMRGDISLESTTKFKTANVFILNKDNPPDSAQYLKAERSKLVSKGTDYKKDDSIALYEDDDSIIHFGKIDEINELGINYQEVTTISPSRKDLMAKIEIDTDGKTYKEILEEDLENTIFLYTSGSGIDNPSGDIDEGIFKGLRRDLYAMLDRRKQKRIRIDEWGLISSDDGDTASGITAANKECNILDVNALGDTYNGIEINGGKKEDGSLAKVTVYDLEYENQALTLLKYFEPTMTDDSSGGEIETYADLLLTQLKSVDFIEYKVQLKDKGKPTMGETIAITSTNHSLTAEALLIEEFEYNIIQRASIFYGKNGLFIKANYKKDRPESTLQIVEQVSKSASINEASNEETGFPNRTDSAMSMSTDTFQITVVSGSYDIYSRHEKITIEETKTLDLSGYSNGDGIFVEFDVGTQTLKGGITFWDLTDGDVQVAIVYKLGSSNYRILDERHRFMPGETHKNLHLSEGSKYISGFGLAATPTYNTLSLNSGIYVDEDIYHSIAAQTSFNVSYEDGSGIWQLLSPDNAYYTTDGSGYAEYNNAGTVTSVPNNNFVCYYIFGQPSNPAISISFMGKNIYAVNDEESAEAETFESLDINNLFLAEFKPLYKIIIKSKTTCEYRSIEDLRKITQVGGTPTVGYSDPQAIIALENALNLQLNIAEIKPPAFDISSAGGYNWFKIGTLSGNGADVLIIVNGNTFGSEEANGVTTAQFNIGNADDEFGGFYYHIGQSGSNVSFEWVKTATRTIDCYVYLNDYFTGSVLIIRGNHFTYNDSFNTALTDPSGTNLNNEMDIQSILKIRDGNSIYVQSPGNDKLIQIAHDDTDGNLIVDNGNMKYKVPSSKAHRFYVNNIEICRPDSTGLYMVNKLISGCATYYCSIRRTTNKSISTGSLTIIDFNHDTNDAYGMHDTVTNNSRITIPSGGDGWYLINIAIDFASYSLGDRAWYIHINGTVYNQERHGPAGGNIRMTGCYLINLSATDYIELGVYQDSGTSINLICGTGLIGTQIRCARLSL